MQYNPWWKPFGKFHAADERGYRPDPKEVLLFYLDRCSLTEARIALLMKKLKIGQSVAYEVLDGAWFNSLSRCRRLVDAFSIPPQLLGLDPYYQGKALWWKVYGFPFEAGPDGYPHIGKVIRHFREHMVKEVRGEKKPWTQTDLATALDVTTETVRLMEKRTHLDQMDRREALAQIFYGTATLSQGAPHLFALFGLHEQSFVPLKETAAASLYLPQNMTNLQEHRDIQKFLFEKYHTNHGYSLLEEAEFWLDLLTSQVAPQVSGAQHLDVLALQRQYHIFFGNVAREARQNRKALFHMEKAMTLGDDAIRWTNDRSVAEQTQAKELKVGALYNRAMAQFEQGNFVRAAQDIDVALALCAKLPISHITSHTLIDAGMIHAYAASTAQEAASALSYFTVADRHLEYISSEKDLSFATYDKGMLYLRQAMALCAPKSSSNTQEALDDAERLVSPEFARRRLLIDIFRAQYLIENKEYEQATRLALSALEISRKLHSKLNRDRIEQLYHRLGETTYKYEPLLARLGVQLRMWTMDQS